MIKTYIFGNPNGWTLYNKDQSEVTYFKSFYVNTRRGERLMVNRRDDGSIVYVYLMYGVSEVQTDANGEQKRGGYGHFGMAMVIDGEQYSPEFTTVYRFMSTLFERLLDREDSPIVRNLTPQYAANGEQMPYSYRISKFDEARESIEWLQIMMPKIFEKTGLISMAADSAFEEGTMGKIATLPDDVTDTKALEAFHQNCWIAISPEFKRVDEGGKEQPMEINLYDLSRQHGALTQKVLDWALSGQKVTQSAKENVEHRISEARVMLVNYERVNSFAEDINEARELKNAYAKLATQLDRIKADSILPHTGRVENKRLDDNVNSDAHVRVRVKDYEHHENGIKKPNSILDYVSLKLIGVLSVIVIFVVVSIALINSAGSDDDNGGGSNGGGSHGSGDVRPRVDDKEFQQLIDDNDFAEAYNLVKKESSNGGFIKRLKSAVVEYLWNQVEAVNDTQIYNFFTRSSNSDMLEYLGFENEDNNYREWNDRLTLYKKLIALSSKAVIINEELNEAKECNKALGNRYNSLVDNVASHLARPQPSSNVNIPVTLRFYIAADNRFDEKNNHEKFIKDRNGVTYRVLINEKFKLCSTGNTIRYDDTSINAYRTPTQELVVQAPERDGVRMNFYIENDGVTYPIIVTTIVKK